MILRSHSFSRHRAAIGLLLLETLLLGTLPGCVWYGPASMTRVWADKNTLNVPAVYVERIEHQPLPRAQVEALRWQYGVGPGLPPVAPLPVAAPPTVAAPHPAADASPPPAPPSEMNASPSTAAPISRNRTAWLFTPPRG